MRCAGPSRSSGMPVVCCGLHSQVPLVAAAIKARDENAQVVYCMTDGAALPLGLSDLVRDSLSAGLLDATVTCGQAFGGTLEAINLHSGMLAARHVLGADVVIVAVGPGIVGTATPFGHGGVAQGEAINAAAVLDGVPVACVRMSFADTRERHRGVSHHTLAALSRVALASAVVALPALEPEKLNPIRRSLESAGIAERHRVEISDESAVATTLATWGRSQDDGARLRRRPRVLRGGVCRREYCIETREGHAREASRAMQYERLLMQKRRCTMPLERYTG